MITLRDSQYLNQSRYDALNREVEKVTTDNTVMHHTYNEIGLLEQVRANLRGEQVSGQPNWTPYISNIDYNSKNQRLSVQYGNNVSTNFTYDPWTFRVSRLQTQRNGNALQDLRYFYDPFGNITQVKDAAQQTMYFRNKRVEPSNSYTYDPIYRLTQATGREHLGQTNGQSNGPSPPAPVDTFHTSLDHPGDGNALGIYAAAYKDQLHATAVQNVNAGGTPETTYYVYGANGQRIRTVTERYSAVDQAPTK